jgi:hypothetical protein
MSYDTIPIVFMLCATTRYYAANEADLVKAFSVMLDLSPADFTKKMSKAGKEGSASILKRCVRSRYQ